MKLNYEKEIKIEIDGQPHHDPCISHCLLYAFGICEEKLVKAVMNSGFYLKIYKTPLVNHLMVHWMMPRKNFAIILVIKQGRYI